MKMTIYGRRVAGAMIIRGPRTATPPSAGPGRAGVERHPVYTHTSQASEAGVAMIDQALVAWYGGRHVLKHREGDQYRLAVAALIVAILALIGQYGAWFHPFAPNGSGSASSGNTGISSQSAAVRAVNFALSQVGAPYVYASAGPYKDGYDNSGLVTTAWKRAGVVIPRDANEEWATLQHVSKADIRPGDLLFYDDLDLVAIYIGNNDLIAAQRYGERVSVIPISTPSYAANFDGAVRP